MDINIIYEGNLEDPNSFEEIEVWLDLHLESSEDTYDTPGSSNIDIRDWGVISEVTSGRISYTDFKPEWVTESMLNKLAEEAYGRQLDIMDENPFADDKNID